MKRLLSLDPVQSIFALAALLAGIVTGTALVTGGPLMVTGATAAGFLALGLLQVRSLPRFRETGAATALIGQAIALTAALQGHPWQIDSHMLFFALLASLIVLRSAPAILMATAITAIHHLSLSLLMPALVFPGAAIAENLARTALHAVILLMETGVLVITVALLQRLDSQMQARNATLETTVAQSEAARQEAEAAKAQAESIQAEAQAAQARAETLLKEAEAAEARRAAAEEETQASQQALSAQSEAQGAEQARVVGTLRDALLRLQQGDLTVRIEEDLPESYKDLRDGFNTAVDGLENTITEVALQTQEMKNQVQEIVAATGDLAQRTERQAATLRESSEGLEELTRAVTSTEATVKEASGSAHSAAENAKSSEKIVGESAQTMTAIRDGSDEISQIISVIDDIAFQTNLLALNAGVEAARAGEAGLGFAVVASEVRGLAQRSSSSATSIRELIERSGDQVAAGTSKIEETVTALSEVLAAVFEISSKINAIEDGAREQTTGISDLNRKVAELDSTTQKNAAMFEQTTAACNTLLHVAQALQDLTLTFRVRDAEDPESAAA